MRISSDEKAHESGARSASGGPWGISLGDPGGGRGLRRCGSKSYWNVNVRRWPRCRGWRNSHMLYQNGGARLTPA
jgi:hypothetical protein